MASDQSLSSVTESEGHISSASEEAWEQFKTSGPFSGVPFVQSFRLFALHVGEKREKDRAWQSARWQTGELTEDQQIGRGPYHIRNSILPKASNPECGSRQRARSNSWAPHPCACLDARSWCEMEERKRNEGGLSFPDLGHNTLRGTSWDGQHGQFHFIFGLPGD